MSRRSRARLVVLQVLFGDDLHPDRDLAESDHFLERRLCHFPEVIKFARALLAGVRRNRAQLDELIVEKTENWSLERMAVIDRNILRLGAYEIVYEGTPGPVAINEAIELAKHFGSPHSGAFVNGVLDRILRQPPKPGQPPASPPPLSSVES